jgi:hypothetical protein
MFAIGWRSDLRDALVVSRSLLVYTILGWNMKSFGEYVQRVAGEVLILLHKDAPAIDR